MPEFDEESALDALDSEQQELETTIDDSTEEPEVFVEEQAEDNELENDIDEQSFEDEVEIEDLPEFSEDDALDAAEFEQSYQVDSFEQTNEEAQPVADEESVTVDDSETASESLDALSPDAFLDELNSLADENEQDVDLAIDEAAIEDQFMSEISDTDFDALLNDLAEPEPIDTDSLDDVELNFDTLLNEELNNDIAALSSEVEVETDNNNIDVEEFLDIDDLIAQSDEFESEEEPYQEANMDVGLGDFEDLLAGENAPDVDLEADGFSAKLDLARAYIEIDDSESALAIIEEVINSGPDSVQAEAASLRDKLQA